MAALPAAAALLILFLVLMASALPLHAQTPPPAPSRIDPAVQAEIDRLYVADKIEPGRGFRALEDMGPRAAPAVPHLIRFLGDESHVGRPNPPGFWEAIGWTSKGNAAAMTLVKIGEPAIDPLINSLGDRNRLVRSRAARTLQQITGQNFKENQAAWRNWRRPQKARSPAGP